MDKNNIFLLIKDKIIYNIESKELDLTFLINEFNLLKEPSLKYNNHLKVLNKNNKNSYLNLLNLNELYKICEYYGLLKNIKISKYKKIDIINTIEIFETNKENKLIVDKRKKLWFYINELSNDNIMKKYIIWN